MRTAWFSSEQAEGRELWHNLTAAPKVPEGLRDDYIYFLAGGSFVDNAQEPDVWQKFTIWGGFNGTDVNGENVGLDPATGKITAVSLEDLDPEGDLFNGEVPGFRVVMERTLRPDWRLVLRSDTVFADRVTPEMLASSLVHWQALGELLPTDELAAATESLPLYEALAAYRIGELPEVRKLLDGQIEQRPTDSDITYLQLLSDAVALDAAEP